MALNFPNPSRSYDAARHCVCFWGYDNAREVAFQVTDEILLRLSRQASAEETALLAIFDHHRDQILQLARDLYNPGERTTYTIS
ncbi:DUF1488 domain-containing protein [Cupriavidus sp. MP-37]|uniref:DUF1488 domain-containing protein n=1 Tax=Cupriavidus sp. MP-37 TaxID=2884455 RepID=UPI001D0ACB45|nr:DUF1488 domain-containing protein [Cupriavidus sp. MP-37]UDM51625.1 DUF1488 domain-containing protein [Cupriavidus sp. MP-37]